MRAQRSQPANAHRMLLAEDDAEMRDMLVSILAIEGFHVASCCDGVELVDRLNGLFNPDPEERDHWDMIVAASRMRRIDALAVLSAMRDYVGFPPVCLITAFGDPSVHQQARRLGAAAVLDKPFTLREFCQTIDNILNASNTTPLHRTL